MAHSRWGAIHPLTEKINAHPTRYAAIGAGCLVDWSGLTAVMTCLYPGCGENFGPVFDREDVATAAQIHRDKTHTRVIPKVLKNGQVTYTTDTTVSADAKEQARLFTLNCSECGIPTKTYVGLCSPCRRKAQWAMAVELGELPEDSPLAAIDKLFIKLRDQNRDKATDLYNQYQEYKGPLTWPEWWEEQRAPESKPKPKRKVVVKPRVPKPLPHGTISGYMYHKCRCDLCRQANSDYARERRHAS